LKIGRAPFSVDRALGYPAYRSWHPQESLPDVVADFRPDVCVALAHRTAPTACKLLDLGLPTVLSLQDAEFEDSVAEFSKLRGVKAVANSAFTARAYKRFGIQAQVIHPPIDRELYETERVGDEILFINPVEEKGVLKAVEIATLLPDLKFRFMLTWPLSKEQLSRLSAQLQPLRNVTLAKPRGRMKDVYRQARLLLAPSQWQEGYGRVVTEAQFSGIPVLGSDRGGLPEAIGRGGVILSADAPASEWASVLTSMLETDRYEELSRSSKIHASRRELHIEWQIAAWETVISEALHASSGQDVSGRIVRGN